MALAEHDYYTKRGAQILADRIVSYWRSLGYQGVEARIWNITGLDAPHWGVRSNIRNGFPPPHLAVVARTAALRG